MIKPAASLQQTEEVEQGSVVTEYQPRSAGELWQRIDREDLVRLGVVGGLAVVVLVASWLQAPWWISAPLAAVGLVIGCWPIVVEVWAALRARRMSMELSMFIALVAAAAIGEWVTALVITVFVLAAEILEDLSMDRGRDALGELMNFLPDSVQVRRDGQLRSVHRDELAVGDVVMVLPGGRIPVDGVVLEGNSSVDESRITGEPLPVDVSQGSQVYAGSINHSGAVALRAERVGAESSYGQIVAAISAAQNSQAPIQRLADRLAGWLVYLALGGAALTYLITRDLTATISVIIVAGACGVAAGTPLALLGAIGQTARAGTFIKDGSHLEELSAVRVVVFDKTGTLTKGEPAVTAVTASEGVDGDHLLAAVASAESYSEHPIGQAIVGHARERGLQPGAPSEFEYRPGQGVSALVDGHRVLAGTTALVPAPAAPVSQGQGTMVHVSIDGSYAGTIELADEVRDSAAACVADLRKLGLRVIMMTGDSQPSAEAVARRLGIDEVHAGLLPAGKVDLVERLRASGSTVAMVGDGINDAPALMQANVGIAMGNGTHVARESADVVLVSSDLGDLTQAIHTARRTRGIIMTNFVGTIAVDLIGMAMAATGVLGPLAAAVVHVGSESAFILNSARLIPSGKR
ncbi:MAG: cadmium-translocating P-type ATPase [Propionibacterium sp.]|nr:cadmium-translocating P-type ATPase [Propionibacterium sp.]